MTVFRRLERNARSTTFSIVVEEREPLILDPTDAVHDGIRVRVAASMR
jgi:hypothetical protein